VQQIVFENIMYVLLIEKDRVENIVQYQPFLHILKVSKFEKKRKEKKNEILEYIIIFTCSFV
jgi:hypothetical protein